MIKYSLWENALTEMKNIGSIYVWGGQGELRPTDDFIYKKETSKANAKRDITLRDKRYKAGFLNLRCFDCSGLGIYLLQQFGEITYDTNANGLMKKCTKISRSDLRPGDFVFRVKDNAAYHIGYVISDLRVIHAKGRDVGVVEETLNAEGNTYWNAYGRSPWIEEKKDDYSDYIFTQNLYRKKCSGKYMEDVKALQWFLNENGFNAGTTDGYFGKNTEKAVKKCQKTNKLKRDGIAGKNTIKALGGTWK